MEAIFVAIAPQVVPVVGALLVGLVSWGIAILKKKVKLEAGKAALDQVDQIVGTVVGNLGQTAVKKMKEAATDGHLTRQEKGNLKSTAIAEVERLVSREVSKAASKAVDDLGDYVGKKIEERVLNLKFKI